MTLLKQSLPSFPRWVSDVSRRGDPPRRWDRIPVGVRLLGMFLMCLVSRLLMAGLVRSVCHDGYYYISAAAACRDGEWIYAFNYLNLNIYPLILVSVQALGLSWIAAGKLWSVLVSSLLVLPMFGWVRRLFSDRVAWAACFLYAVHPEFIEFSIEPVRDPTFWLLFNLCLYATWRGFGSQARLVSRGRICAGPGRPHPQRRLALDPALGNLGDQARHAASRPPKALAGGIGIVAGDYAGIGGADQRYRSPWRTGLAMGPAGAFRLGLALGEGKTAHRPAGFIGRRIRRLEPPTRSANGKARHARPARPAKTGHAFAVSQAIRLGVRAGQPGAFDFGDVLVGPGTLELGPRGVVGGGARIVDRGVDPVRENRAAQRAVFLSRLSRLDSVLRRRIAVGARTVKGAGGEFPAGLAQTAV